MITRAALHRNRLNLGAWHGFQEVIYRRPLDLQTLEFSFRLEPGAHLSVILYKTSAQFSGVRLSRHDAFPSASFTATDEGRFQEVRPIEVDIPEGWHRCTVAFDTGDVLVDGRRVVTVAQRRGKRFVGFRGGFAAALVDDVRLSPRAAAPVRETFRNSRGALGVFALALLGTVLLQVAALVLSRAVGGSRAPLLFDGILISLCSLVVSAGLFGIDHLVLSRQYPTEVVVDLFEYPETIESGEEVKEKIRRLSPPPTGGILFLGTSQTWGAGVTREDDTFARRIERELGVVSVNAGVAGADSTLLLESYRTEWIDLAPRVTVVTLANNDTKGRALVRNLFELVTLNRSRGIQTLFVLEPNSIEYDARRPLEIKHRLMRGVASRTDVPVVEMDAYLAEHHDDGFLWWDHVHLTSFGHRLFADRLAPELRRLLAPDPAPPARRAGG
jgi:lysophospholipase L1-like esterase